MGISPDLWTLNAFVFVAKLSEELAELQQADANPKTAWGLKYSMTTDG